MESEMSMGSSAVEMGDEQGFRADLDAGRREDPHDRLVFVRHGC